MRESLENSTDEEIVGLVQAGEAEIFTILINRYEEKIRRYARKFISNQEDINDVLQEIFIKAYRNIQSFDIKRKFSSWLYRIAHNELVNALKRKKTFFTVDLDVFFPFNFHKNDLDEQIDRQSMIKIIDECLGKLSPKYREPIVLYYLEGLSYKEIADVMQIPISTVGIRIKRAKSIIKSILNHKE